MVLEQSERPSFQYHMPNLDVRNPPDDLSYSEFEDFRTLEILKINGVSSSATELHAALENNTSILQAAAAHALGSLPSLAANTATALRKLLADSDDLVKAEAAYALARHGVVAGKEVLIQCLGYRLDAYLCPAIAAGYLAKLGDPRGFSTIVQCLDVNIPAIRMLACKQLFFFVPFQGVQDERGHPIDVFREFERALRDTDTNIQWQALVQLRQIGLPNTKQILEAYVGYAILPKLRDIAMKILGTPAKPGANGGGLS